MPDHPFSPGDRVIAYLRDSGHEQQELSTERQADEIRAFCAKNGLILLPAYIDTARPGSSDNRPRLAEMMYALRHGLPVVGVIVWSSSRFARNSLHAQFYRSEIRKLGYKFHSLTGKNIDGPEAIIFEAVDDYANELYLTNLSLDVKSGLRKLVHQFGCVPGTPPRGFMRQRVEIGRHRDGSPRVAHRWVPDPATAPLVRLAFEMRAAGRSLNEINAATGLYASINSYRTFWPNKLYLGLLEFAGETIPNYCEPIVPRETWDAVQERQGHYTRSKHAKSKDFTNPRRAGSRFLLSGLAYCPLCGTENDPTPLHGHASTQVNKKRIDSYLCPESRRNRCQATRISAEALEAAVIRTLREHILQPGNLAALHAAYAGLQARQTAQIAQERKDLETRLDRFRSKIRRTVSAISEHGHSRALLEQLSQLEAQELTIQTRLAQLDRQPTAIPSISESELSQRAQNISEILATGSIIEKQTILRAFIEKITAFRDGDTIRGAITYYYPPPEVDQPGPGNGSSGPGPTTTPRAHLPAPTQQNTSFCAHAPVPTRGADCTHRIEIKFEISTLEFDHRRKPHSS